MTASVKMYGEVDVNKAGEYKVTYSCENADGDKREVSAVVTVEGEETANESSSDNGKKLLPMHHRIRLNHHLNLQLHLHRSLLLRVHRQRSLL